MRASAPASSLAEQMVQAYAANDRMYQVVLEQLDPRAWRAQPPGKGKRSIAAIIAHVHNIRCKWLRLSAPHLKRPALLDRSRCTPTQAQAAMAQSAARCCEMLSEALVTSQGSTTSFLRDGWARPWAPGAAMFGYMLAHDAHHRGQVCMLAHQLGYPLPSAVGSGMWAWEKLWKECGFELPRPDAGTRQPGRRLSSGSQCV